MSYWRQISPRGAIADLVHEWQQPNPYRWHILCLSVALTFTMMVLLIPDSTRVPPAHPEVTFISTFDPNRTDAEIVASNIENQKRKEARQAEAAARAERSKQAAKALGRATGIDVDAMERRILREQAEEAARAKAREEAAEANRAAGER